MFCLLDISLVCFLSPDTFVCLSLERVELSWGSELCVLGSVTHFNYQFDSAGGQGSRGTERPLAACTPPPEEFHPPLGIVQ